MKRILFALLLVAQAALGQNVLLGSKNTVVKDAGIHSYKTTRLCMSGATSGSVCLTVPAIAGTGTLSVGTGLELSALAGLTSAANSIPYFTGSGTAALLIRDTDVTLAADSDTRIATQKATKAYVDAQFAGAGTGDVDGPGSSTVGHLATWADTSGTTLASTATLDCARTPSFTGDVTSSAGNCATTIAADAVTYAKLQDVSAASKLLGRGDSGSGDPQEITIGSNLTMIGTTLSAAGGSGGGWVLLESHAASNSASLDFTTRNAAGQSGATIQSDYKTYVVVIDELVPVTTTGVDLLMTVSTDGGSTYLASTTYRYINRGKGDDGAVQSTASTGAASISMAKSGATAAWFPRANGGNALYGSLRLFGFTSAANYKAITGENMMTYPTAIVVAVEVNAQVGTTTALNAFKFAASGGNISSGTIYLYGVAQ